MTIVNDPEKKPVGPTTDHSPLTTHHSLRSVVVKVGGSLLNWPELGDRLQQWLAALGTPNVVLVVGGGPAAELVRRRDAWDDLGDERSHWLAVRAMTFNSYLIEGLLENSKVVATLRQCESLWQDGIIPILDAHTFMVDDAVLFDGDADDIFSLQAPASPDATLADLGWSIVMSWQVI